MRRRRGFGKREVARSVAAIRLRSRSIQIEGAQASQNAAHGGRREVQRPGVMEPGAAGAKTDSRHAGFSACAHRAMRLLWHSDHRHGGALLDVGFEPSPAVNDGAALDRRGDQMTPEMVGKFAIIFGVEN